MIFSVIEMVSEHEGVHKVLVKGKNEDIALELENIITELLKRGFPEDLIMSVMYNALKNTGNI